MYPIKLGCSAKKVFTWRGTLLHALIFLVQYAADLVYQFQQPFGVLLDCSLLTQLKPPLFRLFVHLEPRFKGKPIQARAIAFAPTSEGFFVGAVAGRLSSITNFSSPIFFMSSAIGICSKCVFTCCISAYFLHFSTVAVWNQYG